MRSADRITRTALSIVALLLAAGLAGCAHQPSPPAPPPPGAVTAAPTPAPVNTTAVTPAAIPSPTGAAPSSPTAPSSPPPEVSPQSGPTALPPAAAPTQFFLGLPAGDCYGPMDLVADANRGAAYVYCGSSPARRPLISVVDLAAGKVVRTIPLAATEPAGQARLLLLPGGDKLMVLDSNEAFLTVVDTASGALSPALDEFREGILSEDGRTLYALGTWGLRAYAVSELLAGRGEPLWSAPERFERIAVNADRVLASALGPERRVVAFDALTGQQVATAELPDLAGGLATGPDGSWAVTLGGMEPAVLRLDANLNVLSRTAAPYGYDIAYDPERGRYLLAGYDPRREGKNFIVSLAESDLAEQAAVEWRGYNPPSVFVSAGQDRLAGITRSGEARLILLDAVTLAPAGSIPLGITLSDLALDQAAGLLYVADNQARVHILNVANGEIVAMWAGAGPIELDIANHRLYVNGSNGVEALDATTGRKVAQFGRSGMPAPDPARDLVYIISNGITLHDRTGAEIGCWQSSFRDPQGYSPNPSAIAGRVQPDTGYLVTVIDNGVPGSNSATYLQLYPPGQEQPQDVPGRFTSVWDAVFGPQGETYASYRSWKGTQAVQRLGPDGSQTGLLLGRTGLLLLDEEQHALYVLQDGAVARLDSATLALEEVFSGPAQVSQVVFDSRARRLYTRSEANPTLAALALDDLPPLDQRPQTVGAIPADTICSALLAVPAAGGERVYAVFSDSLYRTADATAWERLPVSSLPGMGQLAAVGESQLFYSAAGGDGSDGAWRTTDGGNTWQLLSRGLRDLNPDQGVLASGAGEAYFASRSEGLLRWNENAEGGKWERARLAAQEEPQYASYSLAPDGALFLTAWQTLQRSTDRGATWQALKPPSDWGSILGFSTPYTGTYTVFGLYGERNNTVVRSTDAGQTWAPVNLGMDIAAYGWPPELAAGPDAVYLLLPARYEGPPAELLRSTDEGVSWAVASAGFAGDVEQIAAGAEGRLWLASRGGLRWVTAASVPWETPDRSVATPAPTRVAPPTLAPTPAPEPTPCGRSLDPDDDALARRFPALGCPQAAAVQTAMARQLFERGAMIWRADTRVIYVLSSDGRWQSFDDAWVDGMPASDDSIVPPAGRYQPVRGFGLVWRTRLGEPAAAVGWAVEPEQGLPGAAQAWDGGELLRVGDASYVLLADGQWR